MRLWERVNKVLTGRQKKMMIVMYLMMLLGAGLETIGTSLILPFITVAMNPDSVLKNKYLRSIYDYFHMTSINSFLIMFPKIC